MSGRIFRAVPGRGVAPLAPRFELGAPPPSRPRTSSQAGLASIAAPVAAPSELDRLAARVLSAARRYAQAHATVTAATALGVADTVAEDGALLTAECMLREAAIAYGAAIGGAL